MINASKLPGRPKGPAKEVIYASVSIEVKNELRQRSLREGGNLNFLVEKALRQFLRMPPLGDHVMESLPPKQ